MICWYLTNIGNFSRPARSGILDLTQSAGSDHSLLTTHAVHLEASVVLPSNLDSQGLVGIVS